MPMAISSLFEKYKLICFLRILFITIAPLVLFVCTAESAAVSKVCFSWLKNEEPEVTGYKIYCTDDNNVQSVTDVGNPPAVDGRVGFCFNQTFYTKKLYTCYATAYSTTEESGKSNDANFNYSIIGLRIR